MSDNPYVRVRIQISNVIVEVQPNRIKQRIIDKALLQTALIALIPSRVTVAYGCPCRPNFGAAAGEEEVVVQLVFLDGRTAVPDKPESRSSFDGDDYGAVVRRHKDVTPKPISVRFPTERIFLG